MFEKFLTKLKHALSAELPGEKIQYLMAPAVRQPLPAEMIKDYKPRASGVLILLYPENEELYTILMLRPSYDGIHSNQISLPGGKKEAVDKNLIETAYREANEEIGLNIHKIELIGTLTNLYVFPSNFCISPVVVYCNEKPDFKIDTAEVAELIKVPLKTLTDKNIIKSKTMKLSGGFEIDTPYYDVGGKVVWGATAMILSEFIFIINEINK